MTAQILLDAAPGPKQLLVPGNVALTNFNDTGVLGWQWDLADKPPGSVASIAAPNNASTVLNVDLPGSYLIRLRTYKDAARTIADGADSSIAYMRYTAPHTWRLPAAGETAEVDPTRGWADEVNDILVDIRTSLGAGSLNGKVYYTYVVGNALAGDPAADVNYLDPGDCTGIAAARTALGANKGRIIVRRGTYTCGATFPVIPLGADQALIFEEGAKIIARAGDAATLPWMLFNLNGEGARIENLTIEIPDRAPVVPLVTTPIQCIAINAKRVFLKNIRFRFQATFAVSDTMLSLIDFGDTTKIGGQIVDGLDVDYGAVVVTGHVTNVYGVAAIGGGDPNNIPQVAAFSASDESIILRNIQVKNGIANTVAVPPYTTIGMALSTTADYELSDSNFYGNYVGVLNIVDVLAGTTAIRGPLLRNVGIYGPADPNPGFLPSGVYLWFRSSGGTLNVDRCDLNKVRSHGQAGGGLSPGVVIFGPPTGVLQGVSADHIVARTYDNAVPAIFQFTGGSVPKKALLHDVDVGPAPGFTGSGDISISSALHAKVIDCACDTLTISGSCTDTIVADNTIRTPTTGYADGGVGTSIDNNITYP